mmetsp:Transcript_12771/g.39223  ORF Transcript_12771/g.39223 Transcript_12771/m.39223 type:complete len:394 (+) Transcript_12771:211-1392(+)|eukprot:CAMPEP_0198733914 /NCGR_PEP_ID=MMETSP1475-20131203/49136_1 /TAXON_ID= ORGANISM="Unidentified sp., Strain CCMP1999" /NCGR_SAMPLE_ID=MMETSP1475 /ASSEMBLY_ACC=CAM_ASM_001111 /LENGTH=393 /DNA_ID=CAMNT_0044497287 /DNA_START=190 /DNA_END=1371 /DNA_ORIENTATION=-
MSECRPPETSNANLGIAFGLVAAAGMSSAIGGAITFLLPYKDSKVNRWLAAALAVAAGVMIYVSFAEIFSVKTVEAFEACIENSSLAYLYATLTFFGGALLCWGFDILLHRVDHWLRAKMRVKKEMDDLEADLSSPQQSVNASADAVGTTAQSAQEGAPHAIDITVIQDIYSERQEIEARSSAKAIEEIEADTRAGANTEDSGQSEEGSMKVEVDSEVMHDGQLVATMYMNEAEKTDKDARSRLARMGLFAALAIAFHNFPEGLATFVAALEDPAVGASVAIAIGVHNIPEGICVAVPIYYATGSKTKAFLWASLSGVTELIGAVLGYIILRKVFNQIAYGVLFGIVAGMMVYISLAELLPTAHRYDPNTQVVTVGLIFGMAIMALSLVLFML